MIPKANTTAYQSSFFSEIIGPVEHFARRQYKLYQTEYLQTNHFLILCNLATITYMQLGIHLELAIFANLYVYCSMHF